MAKTRAGIDSAPTFSNLRIDLPDLTEPSGIQPANILALQPIYVAAQLEQLKIFSVVDRLVELAQNGMLPLGDSESRRMLDDYRNKSGSRMTPAERLNVYARAFGIDSSGSSSPTVNREFGGLWVRFVSAVSALVRQLNRGKPSESAQISVKKRARELAENLSLHGYGIGHFAASELQTQTNDMIAILSDPHIRSAYGATSLWQVVGQIAASDLGGAVTTARYRTMAIAGAIIIQWLAQRARMLASAGKSPVLNVKQIREGVRSSKPMLKPTDRDLTDACQQWLAAVAIGN